VNAPKEHRIGQELQREFASADAVDLVCAFVRWYGLRILEAPLRRCRSSRSRPCDRLHRLRRSQGDALLDWGAEVKVS
jgi:hypothetical protein